MLLATDRTTNKLVLEVGTENIDDYYPGFVGRFHPENMAVNCKKEQQHVTNEVEPGQEVIKEGAYRPLGNMDVVCEPVQVKCRDSLIVNPKDTKVRLRVIACGTDVTRVKAGDIVLPSGRVHKVLAKDLLAEYVTVFYDGNQERIVIPEAECKMHMEPARLLV
jgi:hypothetical protein